MSAVARIIEDVRAAPRMKGSDAASVAAAINRGIQEGTFAIASCALGARAVSAHVVSIQMHDRWRVLDTQAGMAFDFVPENQASGSDLVRAGAMASVREAALISEHEQRALMGGVEVAPQSSAGAARPAAARAM